MFYFSVKLHQLNKKNCLFKFPRLPNNSISWDGSTYANELVEPGEDNIPPGAVSYFVAGKLGT